MEDERDHDVSYYCVRVPHFVLVHGEQLARGRSAGGLTQEQMWPLVDAHRGHASETVGRLRDEGYLDPSRPLRLGAEMGLMVGVSLGHESLRAAVIDANGEIRASAEAPPVKERLRRPPAKTLDEIADVVNEALSVAMATAEEEHDKPEGMDGRRPLFVTREIDGRPRRGLGLLGAAVAWPIPLNRYTKVPAGQDPTILAIHDGWHGERVVDLVADRLGIERRHSHALNDANAAALAAVFDEIRDINAATAKRPPSLSVTGKSPEYAPAHVSMTIRIGGGVGAGTVTVAAYDPARFSSFNQSALMESEYGIAGEIGHINLDAASLALVNKTRGELPELSAAAECSCGGTGHLEAVASVGAFIERVRGLDPEILTRIGLQSEDSRGAAAVMHDAIARIEEHESHPALERALKDIGRLVGHAVAGSVLMLAPQTITITGSAACEPLRKGLKTGISERGGFHGSGSIEITCMRGRANAFSPARGAALSVFRRVVYRRLAQFERLYTKSGKRLLPDGQRLFSNDMYLVSPTDLPFGAGQRRRIGSASS